MRIDAPETPPVLDIHRDIGAPWCVRVVDMARGDLGFGSATGPLTLNEPADIQRPTRGRQVFFPIPWSLRSHLAGASGNTQESHPNKGGSRSWTNEPMYRCSHAQSSAVAQHARTTSHQRQLATHSRCPLSDRGRYRDRAVIKQSEAVQRGFAAPRGPMRRLA